MDALFRVLTLALCDGNDLGQGLRQALLLLREHFPVARLSLTAASSPEGRGVVRIMAETDDEKARRMDVLVPLSEEAARWTSEITTDDVLIVDEPEAHPLFRLLNDMEDDNTGSLMIGPLGIGRRPVGCLTVFGPTRGCFTAEHARLLKTVNEPFAIALEHHLQRDRLLHLQQQLLEDRRELERDLWSACSDTIIGEHFGLREVMAHLRRVAPSPAPVLLLGETGVGKDVLANALHRRSARSSGPFVKLDCGALSENLVDSELFGHEAGAFTGARGRHRGRFERAQGGTLFLDEIGELPASAQLRLLRVLQHGEIERVGGSQTIEVDVRIVAATHRDLRTLVSAGTFREDLWFRLDVFPIHVPPLRERRGDILALAEHILKKKSAELRKGNAPELAPESLAALLAYPWPGNVRELENVLERAMIIHDRGPLHVEIGVGRSAPATEPPLGPPLTLDEAMSRHIEQTLERTEGKIHGENGAAALLGIPATTLRHRMDRLGISYIKRKRA